jgi:hypothetical protein
MMKRTAEHLVFALNTKRHSCVTLQLRLSLKISTSLISHTRTKQVASVFRIRIEIGFNQVSGS